MRLVWKVALTLVVIPVLVLGVLVFNATRYDADDPRARPNGYTSIQTIAVDQPVEVVFDFVQRGIPEIYTQMSPMHERYEILNADALIVGAEVDCLEGDPNQITRHHYVVTAAEAPNLLAMESIGTEIIDRASGDHIADIDVWVYFDLTALGAEQTELTQTVVIDMRNPAFKVVNDIMTFVTGTRELWEQQFVEELQVLGEFAERHVVAASVDDA